MRRTRTAACPILAVVALVALPAPARANTLVLVCKWQDVENTYYVDFAASTVTTSANSAPGSGQLQTFRAEITDRAIRWQVAGVQTVTIDRYSGTMGFNYPTNVIYHCRVAARRAIE
jgi:hypothetical protein